MPNWTYNVLTMSNLGSKDVFSLDKNGRKYLDFEKIVPSPKSEEEYLKQGGDKYQNPQDAHVMEETDRPWFNWYDWNIDNWGTKWNACDTDVVDDDTVTFNTAWAAPTPIFEALAKKYPEKSIRVESEYEDGDYSTEMYYKGNLVSEAVYSYSYWDDNSKTCREESSMEYYSEENDFITSVEEMLLKKMAISDPCKHFRMKAKIESKGRIKAILELYGIASHYRIINLGAYFDSLKLGTSLNAILSHLEEIWDKI